MRKLEKQLFAAVAEGNVGEVRRLLMAGVSPNVTANGEITPLMVGARNNNVPMVQLLLGNGANAALTDYLGRDAIDYAEKYKATDALLAILTYREDVGDAV